MTTVAARPGSTGPLWQRANRNGETHRKTTSAIISGYRATAVIDTPMRKVEVLETHDGRVIVRDTEYAPGRDRADVGLLYLEYHEAQALAATLRELEPPESVAGNGKARA